MRELQLKFKEIIRDVHDFPKEGIVFKDISTVLLNPELSNQILDHLVDTYKDKGLDKIVGIESRGFLFGFPLAMRLGVPFVMLRKEGKLPYDKVKASYDLEYGKATIEMHTDAVLKGEKVLIHDDLLATGGSANAAARLINSQGAEIFGFNFLIKLNFLNGEAKLNNFTDNIVSLADF